MPFHCRHRRHKPAGVRRTHDGHDNNDGFFANSSLATASVTGVCLPGLPGHLRALREARWALEAGDRSMPRTASASALI